MKRAAAAWRYESLVSRRCGEDWQKQSFQTARTLLRPAKSCPSAKPKLPFRKLKAALPQGQSCPFASRKLVFYKLHAALLQPKAAFLKIHSYITLMQHPLERFHHCPLCGSRRFVIHNEKSRHCDDCGLTYYANPSAATVALIVNDRGEMLVARRKKEPARGTLDLPGGFVDMEETAEEGVRREVKEETGLDVVASEFLFSLPNIYPYSGVDVHTLDLFFRCKVADASHAAAMDDVAETFWLPIDRIDPDDFGLRSIRQGVIRLLEHREWVFT